MCVCVCVCVCVRHSAPPAAEDTATTHTQGVATIHFFVDYLFFTYTNHCVLVKHCDHHLQSSSVASTRRSNGSAINTKITKESLGNHWARR